MKRKRVYWLVPAVLVLAAGGWAVQRFALPVGLWDRVWAPDELNVLLITCDTTRADYLGCYGRTTARTPNIDQLASEGTLFRYCRSCSSLTLPSHSSILTGVYPYAHGARCNGSGRLSERSITLAETLRDQGYRTQATVATYVLARKFGTSQGFEDYHDVVITEMEGALQGERKGDEVSDDAIQMLRTVARQPFFLWVHFFDPHAPYESPRVADRFTPAAYEHEIAFMDAQIGRLLDEVNRLGLGRRTLVVLTADHGEGLGQHQESQHGFFLYETTLHVPLIFRLPGRVEAGRRVAAQVRTVDIAPTILDLLGRPPWEHAHGTSLAPLLSGAAEDLHLAAYAESLEAHLMFRLAMLRSLTVDRWKYVLAPKPELYDLQSDPDELHDRAAEQPERCAGLREQLRALLAKAPPPPEADEVRVALRPVEIEQLQALGYAGAASGGYEAAGTELERFEPEGGNPRDYAPMFELQAQAAGALFDRRIETAEQTLRRLLDAFPEAAGVQLDLARVLRRQERPEEADQAFQRAAELSPRDPRTRCYYGDFLLFSARQYERALEQYSAAHRLAPDEVHALYGLGATLTALQRYGEAEAHLQRALAVEPQTPRVLQALGVIRLKQNRLAEAEDYFRQTLALMPESAEARAALQFLQQRRQP